MKTVVLIVAIAILFFIGGYSVGTNKQIQQSSIKIKSITPTPAEAVMASIEDKARTIIEEFEQAQIDRKSNVVLKLMTPSASPKEKDEYIGLMGMDLPELSPRLYMTAGYAYTLSSYKIMSITKTSDSVAIANVEEARKVYDNSTAKWTTQAPVVKVFEIERISPFLVLVSNYYNKGQTPQKYAGF